MHKQSKKSPKLIKLGPQSPNWSMFSVTIETPFGDGLRSQKRILNSKNLGDLEVVEFQMIVILDCAPCHTAQKVQEFISAQKKLDVFYIPPRSPEFNPAEKVWHHFKHHELKSHKARSIKELKILARKKMRKIARNKDKVVRIFSRCEKPDLYLH